MKRDEARKQFSDAGLTYNDITPGDICVLVMLLNKELKEATKSGKMSVCTMAMSEKIQSKYTTGQKLLECYLFMNSHYFKQRECISFNKDGFIGFAGWADNDNVSPVLAAFSKWVDTLKAEVKR